MFVLTESRVLCVSLNTSFHVLDVTRRVYVHCRVVDRMQSFLCMRIFRLQHFLLLLLRSTHLRALCAWQTLCHQTRNPVWRRIPWEARSALPPVATLPRLSRACRLQLRPRVRAAITPLRRERVLLQRPRPPVATRPRQCRGAEEPKLARLLHRWVRRTLPHPAQLALARLVSA